MIGFYFIQYLQVNFKSYTPLKAVTWRCSINEVFLKISQNSLENTCTRVSSITMSRAVASVPCQEYVKDKILTHISFFKFISSLFSFYSVLIFPFKILYCIYIVVLISEAYSEPCQTSMMKLFAKIVNGLKPVTIFGKNSILDIWQGSEYSFGWLDIIVEAFLKIINIFNL